jgi:hypothetical protein
MNANDRIPPETIRKRKLLTQKLIEDNITSDELDQLLHILESERKKAVEISDENAELATMSHISRILYDRSRRQDREEMYEYRHFSDKISDHPPMLAHMRKRKAEYRRLEVLGIIISITLTFIGIYFSGIINPNVAVPYLTIILVLAIGILLFAVIAGLIMVKSD